MPPINGKTRVFFPFFWNPSFLHKAAKQIVAMTQNKRWKSVDEKRHFLKALVAPRYFLRLRIARFGEPRQYT